MKKYAFIFPGQGAQYLGMGKDIKEVYPIAKETFEEADDLLKRNLSKIIWGEDSQLLTETRNSQPAIFVNSIALLRTLNSLHPDLKPTYTAGLSLGEYTALVAADKISFKDALLLVQKRGELMSEAADKRKGTMAVVMGLDGEVVKKMVKEANLPLDLYAANFNCPLQVVISGSEKGIEVGTELAKKLGAKKGITP